MMEKLLRAFPYVRGLEADIDLLCGELDDARREIAELRAPKTLTPAVEDAPEGAGSPAKGTENKEQAANIFFYMKIRDVTQEDIAVMAGVTRQMVQRVIYGLSTSHRVQSAIAAALGFDSWTALTSVKRGVAA